MPSVRIAAARLQPYALPLKAEWQSAAGSLSIRHGWLIRLETTNGLVGYGECAPLPSHGTEDPQAANRALDQWASRLRGQSVETALTELAAPATFATPAARAAMETALLDLLSQSAGSSLAAYLCQREIRQKIATNAMLGAATQVSDTQVADVLSAGFSVIKLKVGISPFAAEIAAVHRIARQLGTGEKLRLDANCAWTMKEAIEFGAALAGFPIESIEEPLAQPTPDLLRELGSHLPYPIALDENWKCVEPELRLRNPCVRRLVLKLAPLGGMIPAFRLAQRASAAGVDCIVTTGIDSACGTLAAAHLAATLGNGLAHGLATSSWLNGNTGNAPVIERGKISVGKMPGLGFRPHSEFFA